MNTGSVVLSTTVCCTIVDHLGVSTAMQSFLQISLERRGWSCSAVCWTARLSHGASPPAPRMECQVARMCIATIIHCTKAILSKRFSYQCLSPTVKVSMQSLYIVLFCKPVTSERCSRWLTKLLGTQKGDKSSNICKHLQQLWCILHHSDNTSLSYWPHCRRRNHLDPNKLYMTADMCPIPTTRIVYSTPHIQTWHQKVPGRNLPKLIKLQLSTTDN